MSKMKFYAAVHSSGFIREARLAENRKQAKKNLMLNWTEELKAEYTVERVKVTRLAPATKNQKSSSKKGKQ
jgi:hypothetical protein